MIKQPHSSNAFTKFYYRPYGFRALFTANAWLLTIFSGGVGYSITGFLNYPETAKIIISAVLILCAVAVLILKKPKVHVSLTSDGFQYRSRDFFPKDCKVKYSDICDVKTHILFLNDNDDEVVYLEIITKDKKEHSFPREFFNKESDFENFKEVVIKKISPPTVPRNIHTSSLDHTGSSIVDKFKSNEKYTQQQLKNPYRYSTEIICIAMFFFAIVCKELLPASIKEYCIEILGYIVDIFISFIDFVFP